MSLNNLHCERPVILNLSFKQTKNEPPSAVTSNENKRSKGLNKKLHLLSLNLFGIRLFAYPLDSYQAIRSMGKNPEKN
jgi:hypothetical protein